MKWINLQIAGPPVGTCERAVGNVTSAGNDRRSSHERINGAESAVSQQSFRLHANGTLQVEPTSILLNAGGFQNEIAPSLYLRIPLR